MPRASLVDNVVQSLRATLPPEGRFVIACLSAPVDSGSRARAIEIAAGRLDWERVVSEAAGHFVVPAVYRFVAAHSAGAVPEAIAARLRGGYAANAVRHLWLGRELGAIDEALSSAGVKALALKGPALAVQAYGELAARQSADLDILVRRDELPRIAGVLAGRGYRARRYESGAVDFGFFRSFEDQFEKQGGLLIDLHLTLAPIYFPFRPDEEAVWRNAVAVEIDGRPIKTLAPDDHLMFSLAHATKHGWGWGSLRAMADIAALSATGRVDWDRDEREMERLGCARMTRLGALLAHAFAGAPVPASVLERAVSDPRTMRLARGITQRLFPAPGLVPSVYTDWMVPVRAIDGWNKRARYFIDRGLRPTIEDWEAMPLPHALYWMYYLTRPMRLLLLHGPRLVQRTMEPAPQ
jgi:Uncharacterised nucleotidyltransferase